VTTTAIPPQIGVVNESAQVRDSDLALICAAIQKGVNRDFAPAWHVSVAVQTFPSEQAVPHGWWKAIVKDGLDESGAAGYHTDEHGQPLIYVDATAGELSLTLDHEVKETLADPFGSRLIAMTLHGKRCRVLAEVCDPPEDQARAYAVDGIAVSDFVLPAFYAPYHHGVRTCFHGKSLAPGHIDRGGYISYVLADGTWMQDTWFGPRPATRTLGRHSDIHRPGESLREMVDRLTPAH
jgi:hypothetical protein